MYKVVDIVECTPSNQALGKAFKKDGKEVAKYLTSLGEDEVVALEQKLASDGFVYTRYNNTASKHLLSI